MKNIIFEENENNTEKSIKDSTNNNQSSEQIVTNNMLNALEEPKESKEEYSDKIKEKIDSSKDEDSLLKSKVEERYNSSLEKIINAIKKINSDEEKIIKSQMPKNERNGSINLPNQIYDMFSRTDIKKSIINNTSNEIKDVDMYYKRKFGKNINNLLALYLDPNSQTSNNKNSAENVNEEVISNVNKIIDEFIYSGMSEYLVGDKSQAEIKKTYENAPFLKQPYVENLFKKIDNILRYAILNDKTISDIDTENAFETTKEDVNKDWFQFSKSVLEEESISTIDDTFLGTFKNIIEIINGKSQSEYSKIESVIKKGKLIKEDNEPNQEESSNQDIELSDIKYKLIDVYNQYRKNLYNKTINILHNIKYNNDILENIYKYFSDKNIYNSVMDKLNSTDEKINGCNNVLKDYIIPILQDDKNVLKELDSMVSSEPEENDSKGTPSSILYLIQTMNLKYLNYSQNNYYKKISELWKKIHSDKRVDNNELDEMIDYLNECLNNEELEIAYKGDAIMHDLYFKCIDYFKNGKNLDIDEEMWKKMDENASENEDLERFRMLMGRYPSYDDTRIYQNVYEKLQNMSSAFDLFLKKYEETLQDNYYFKMGSKYLLGDYFIRKEKSINYKTWNIMTADTNVNKDIFDFLKDCLAYMHLTNYVNSTSKDSRSLSLAKDIIGESGGITEEDICSIFAVATSTHPNVLTVNTMLTILMSAGFSKEHNIKCSRTYIPSRFYDMSPVVIMSESGNNLIGIITFYSYDKLLNLFKGGNKFSRWLYGLLKNNNSGNSIV